MARNKSWCNPDNQECLDALIKEINDDLTVGILSNFDMRNSCFTSSDSKS